MSIVGMFTPTDPQTISDEDNCTLYFCVEDLWKNRDIHKIFIISTQMCESDICLPAFKKYCIDFKKVLFLDVRQCQPGCISGPEIITIVNIKENVIDLQNFIRPYEEKQIILKYNFYNNLLGMSKMDLASLEHEGVPIHYNHQKSRLESIYGDTYYIPKKKNLFEILTNWI